MPQIVYIITPIAKCFVKIFFTVFSPMWSPQQPWTTSRFRTTVLEKYTNINSAVLEKKKIQTGTKPVLPTTQFVFPIFKKTMWNTLCSVTEKILLHYLSESIFNWWDLTNQEITMTTGNPNSNTNWHLLVATLITTYCRKLAYSTRWSGKWYG